MPWAFKACGIFQATCDLGLALQYLVWGDGPESGGVEKEVRMNALEHEGFLRTDLGEKDEIEMGDGTKWERPRAE